MRFGLVTTSVVAAAYFAGCEFTKGVGPGDGGPDGPPDAGKCAGSSLECVGDMLRSCSMAGADAVDTACGWGCVPGADPHCGTIKPAGGNDDPAMGVTAMDLDPTDLKNVTLGNGVTIDGDDGQIGTSGSANMFHSGNEGLENGIDFRFRGPISIFRFKSLTINGTVTLVGGRPIALVVDGPVTIGGTVEATGLCSSSLAGPGGFNGGASQHLAGLPTVGGGSGAATSTTGGGGGGHGSIGGAGDGAAGGVAFGDSMITVLAGGGGGGAGGCGNNNCDGGGGGGALQIVSNTRITVQSGGINAGGCGGKPGTGGGDSGGGGGAGGTILLEAPEVIVAGTLAANGGGGGGGGGSTATAGGNAALGTTGGSAGGGDGNNEQGGSGAGTGVAAGSGGNGTNPGGGGGALGRIRINTKGGNGAQLQQSMLSPGPNDPGMLFSSGSATTQ